LSQTQTKVSSKIGQSKCGEDDIEIAKVSDNNEKRYREASGELKTFWNIGRKAAEEVNKRLNIMVKILHEEHPDWSINRIAHQIWIENEDLDGFSKDKIYRKLDQVNRSLIDQAKQNRNKVLEKSVLSSKHKIIEDSSITNNNNDDCINNKINLPPTYQITNAEITTITENENNRILKDLPEPIEETLSNQYSQENNSNLSLYQELQIARQLLQEAREQIEELNQKVQELAIEKVGIYGNKFKFNATLLLSDQEIPIVVTVFPDREVDML
jgi:hypothetical protein